MNIASLPSLIAHWPVDWMIIAVLAVAIAMETIRGGANRACSLALALPAAFFLFQALPTAAFVGGTFSQLQSPIAQAGIFIVMVLVMYIFAHRIIGFYADSSGAPVQALIAGAATTVLIIIFWLQVPSLVSMWHFGPQVATIFGEAYRLFWFVLAYVALAFVRS